MDNKEQLFDRLKANGLDKYFDKLEPIVRNTIRLYLTSCSEDSIPIGQSKIGGKPDLPASFSWFTETNTKTTKKLWIFGKETEQTITKSLSFIAQINLSQISQFDSENLLPKNGILYFFYADEQDAWGFDIKDQNKFKIIYFDGDLTTLKRFEFPEDLENSRFRPCLIEAKQEISLPSYGYGLDEEMKFTDDEADIYYDKIYEDGNINKLLGYSDNIQGEMELECELVTNGLYCGDPSGYNDPSAKELEPNAKNWRLLLQIDSNDENDMMWGDCGRLYFWIKKEDLVNKQFDKSWFSLQCS
ncbi:YwqG family protein [Flectobacillus sp. DC10W]|uniref:YwqG family protein n=1 Tax=Flectobacillus longus TaxID=2984207 RepID=A0ABT6YQ14_9BACT|nr:YwqG family protein [Flectobacillus longus]MDI9865670.1 YwqG family protein [Flectobacillus longus]